MSVRSILADSIRADAPDSWDVLDVGQRLRSFTDSTKNVAVVVEQRGIATQRFSSDGERIPVEVTLAVWVVVDASRGQDTGDVEDLLEEAAEQMIRILEPLESSVWDGTAERTAYDEQKPAYQFTVTFAGHITQEV